MSEPKILTEEELDKIFEAFRQKACRLELLPFYQVEEEKEELARYEAGEDVPDGTSAWIEEIREAKKVGKKFERLRFIPKEPTSYIKFEIDTGFRQAVRAGEDIRWFSDKEKIAVKDFWLFDEHTLVLMNYSNDGSYLGAALAPSSWLPTYCAAWRYAWDSSDPIMTLPYWNK